MKKKSIIHRNSSIRILIVEDMELYRLAMSMIVFQIKNFELVAAVGSGKEMKKVLNAGNIHIVLMDIHLIGESGILLTKYIKDNHPEVLVLALTMCEDADTIIKMLAAGASGYLLKDASIAEFKDAIKSILNGIEYYSPQVSFQIVNKISSKLKSKAIDDMELGGFSFREIQIVKMVCAGKNNYLIADKLGISVRAVEKHRHNIMKN